MQANRSRSKQSTDTETLREGCVDNKRMASILGKYMAAALLGILCIAAFTGCSSAPEQSASQQSVDATEKIDVEASTEANDSVVDRSVDEDLSSAPEDAPLPLAGYGAKGALADADLTLHDMLVYAAQDEYLAHGEYLAIVDAFGDQKPYTSIITAEETHLSLLRDLFAVYGFEFPSDDSAAHVVTPTSLLESAQAGVQAEVDNIAMYDLFMSRDLPDDVLQVFTRLDDGSKSHLSAFQKQVDKLM